VQGDAMAIGGPLSRGANTIVRGNSSSVGGPFGSLPWGLLGIGPGSRAPRDEHTRPLPMWASLARGVGWLFGTLTLLLLAGLVALVLPRATNVVATTIEEQPLRVAFYGVVGWLLLLPILFVLVVLVVTWIFIPLLALALALLLLVGCVGTCLYGGRRLAHLFNWRVSSLVALTALGLVALRVAGLASFLPLGEYLVGLLSIAVLVMSLGAALMTRFGTDPTGTWIGRKANHNHRHGTHANPAPPTRPAAETPPPPRQEHDFDDATLEALSQLPEDGR